jgi:hypothetical protein
MSKRPDRAPCSPAVKAIRERNDEARATALEEIRELRKDLNLLERILTGKQKPGDYSPFDLAHSAFELFRAASFILDNEALAAGMEEETARARAEDTLHRAGAALLTRPAGWHWISPAGEMHFLGKPGEVEKAAEKLAGLIEPQRKKAAAAKAPDAPAADAPAKAEAPAPAPVKAAEPALAKAPARKAAAKAKAS